MQEEPLLIENKDIYTIFPLQNKRLWNLYKKHQETYWRAEDIDYAADLKDWNKLSDGEKFFIENVLAFFAGSDGIVLENINMNFANEIQSSEARCFYAFQAAIENIHSETYSLLIDTYINDEKRKRELFQAIERIPCITKKANWAKKWMDASKPFALRLAAFAMVEGIYFSGSFCAIFWLKNRGLMTQGLGTSNEFISRDEALHVEFAVEVFNQLKNKPQETQIKDIIKEAVSIEQEFICVSLPCQLIGMNSRLMSLYIEFVADRLMLQMGYSKIYNVENPFDFMDFLSIDGKTNFFEKRVAEYRVANDNSNSFSHKVFDKFIDF